MASKAANVAVSQAPSQDTPMQDLQTSRPNHDKIPPGGAINTTPLPIPRRKPVPSSFDPQKRPYRSRSRKPWQRVSRRTIILISSVALALLILIVGLAAGLSHRSSTQNLPLPSNNGGPYTGDLTYYATGLGACGITSKNGDSIVSVSHIIFDAVSTSADPNQDPLCGKMIRAKRGDASVDLKVVDRCTGCGPRDLDVTEDTFAKLADVSLGRVMVSWSWLESVPGAASQST